MWFNVLIISELDVGRNKKVKIFEKKVQKNLEVKKKVVPLQPVWEKTVSSLTSLRKDNELNLEDEIKLVCNEYKW